MSQPKLSTPIGPRLPRSGNAEDHTEDETVFEPNGDQPFIDSYHLLQMVGHGGMGEVWLADQKQPVRRRVAIKLIKAGMDTREVVARFESERQVLALMDHPAIAKVFDAGSTFQGRPYFVMEYVDGVPITDYCDKNQLDIRRRLDLFVAVCEGVQYAHQKAIIHRDLKPSNILVGEVDGKPRPRIIDFGVAKATSHALTEETVYTGFGKVVGTPGYMSPEQADPSAQGIDTRTDVYSLGVVLYELLVGARPIDLSESPAGREPRIPRPSARMRSGATQSVAAAARNRGADAPSLAREVAGDLDAIALKALEWDRSRRYATPSDLAADIGRYLRHEPVAARQASTAYRALKYARRHRFGVAVASAVALVIISVAAMQTSELRRIRRERDRADRVTGFMTGMFKVSNPSEARGNAITAREILDKASHDISSGLTQDPELQAKMMQIMGRVYDDLGLYPEARTLLSQATAIGQRVLGSNHPETLTSQYHLGWVSQQQGRLPEAEKLLRESLNARRRVLGVNHPETLRSMNGLAATLFQMGRRPEAELLQREALDLGRRFLGQDHPGTLASANNLANILYLEGARLGDAEALQSEALEGRRRVLGPDHPDTLASMQNLSAILLDEGRNAEGEKLLRETLDIQIRILGPKHRQTLSSIEILGTVLDQEGHFVQAEALQRQTLEARRTVLGSDHPETLQSAAKLAAVLGHQGRLIEAQKLLRETLNAQRRVLGSGHPEPVASIYRLGVFALQSRRREEALLYLGEAVRNGFNADLEKDPELKLLHGDRRFEELVAEAKQRAERARR